MDSYDFGTTSRHTTASRPKAAAQPRQPRRTQQPSPSRQRQGERRRTNERRRGGNRLVEFFRDKRTHLALGVALITIAIVMAISAVSHLKNGPIDQSIVEGAGSVGAIASSGTAVQNTGGPLGAWLSHVLMTEGLGIGAFVLVIYLGILGLSLLGAMKCRFWSLTFKCLFTAISISVIIGLVTLTTDSFTHWGGVHGRYVNLWLIEMGSWVTAYAVGVILTGCLVAVYYKPLSALFAKIKAVMPKRQAKDESESDEENGEVHDLDGFDNEHADSEKAAGEEVSFGEEVSENAEHIFAGTRKVNTPRSIFTIDDIDDEPEETPAAAAFISPSAPAAVSKPIIGISAEDSRSATASAADAAKPAGDKEPEFTVAVADVAEAAAQSAAPGEATVTDEPYDHRADLSRYVFPDIDLLEDRPSGPVVDPEEQERNKDLIVKTLLDYRIPIQRIHATVGPTVTLYEVVPAEGVRIAQIQRLENDIALSLSALGIRIIAPIPGAGTVGIEVPNREPQTVSIRSVLSSSKFREAVVKKNLPFAMGSTISNDVFVADLTKMPHILVAGATGQGKSVGLNCIIASLIYAKHPSELKFVFIDPKMVEFSPYRKLERHFLAKLPDADNPIITDPTKVPATLNSLCVEMDKRYELISEAGVRSVEEYNRKFSKRVLNPEKGHRYMPYIVTIVDEFADLIMMGGKEVSMPIARIAQKGRAAGMHMIIATQRPSTDVITGMIKANFPGRIAFRVMQMVDSKTILDRPGANQLIGRGDMLFLHNGLLERVQCAFIDTDEIDAITDHISRQIGYPSAYLLPEPIVEGAQPGDNYDPTTRDALFNDCARFIVQQNTASTSSLQRRFGIGYNKAGKIMDQMEAAGIVGPAQGAKPRAVLMDPTTLETLLQN